MALTPEDVVNKRFQHVKFREGYDQDEVDDFLDEVVVELRRLYQENDSLRQKLSEAETRLAEGETGGSAEQANQTQAQNTEDPQATQAFPSLGTPAAEQEEPQAAAAPASPLVAPAAPAAEPAAAAEEAAPEPEAAAEAAPEATAAAAAPGIAPSGVAPAGAAAAGSDDDAHGLIALAQKVHDEHVAEGKRTRDKLVSEGETEAKQIVASAEKKRDDTLSQLETQKSNLEREIDGLQNFERQYRTRLKSYLSDQLRDLENSGSLAPETLGGNNQGNPKHSL